MESYRKHWYLGWEAKRCYQRNMCIGMGAAIALCVVAVIAGAFLLDGGERRRASGAPGGGGDGTPGDWKDRVIVEPLGAFKNHLRKANEWPNGGFIDQYRIVSDWEIAPSLEYSEGDRKWSLLPDIGDVGPGTGLPEGPGFGFGDSGGDMDFGLPEEEPYLPPVRAKIEWPETDDDVQLDAGLLSALIEFKGSVRWPSSAEPSDTGIVVIAFTIDADACVGDWELIRETPPGLGFARLVKEYLIFNCKYHARIVNGRKVPTRVQLDAVICQDCDQSVVVTGGDLAVKQR